MSDDVRKSKLFKLVDGNVVIPASESFNVDRYFQKGKNGIVYIDGVFVELFGGLIEEPREQETLSCYELLEELSDKTIIEVLGGFERMIISLSAATQFCESLETGQSMLFMH